MTDETKRARPPASDEAVAVEVTEPKPDVPEGPDSPSDMTEGNSVETAEPSPEVIEQDGKQETGEEPLHRASPLLRLLVLLVVAAAGTTAFWAWRQSDRYPMTDAGEVDAPVVNVSAVVPGIVADVAVENNQLVKQGDLLFSIDPEPYELELAQARAALATAESELRQGEGNRELEQSNADVAAKQIERAENNLSLAQQNLDRLLPLLAKRYVTAQEVDTARTAVADAQVTYDQALSSAHGTSEFVGTLDTRQAQVDAARAAVALAERNLRNTEIHAARNGAVTGLQLTPGEFVITGIPQFTLVDTGHWRVKALFRETDLPRVQPGAKARVFLLSAPDLPIDGRVTGIGWGVRSSDEAELLGLPLVASELDWVRAARRFPVEVELIDPPEGLTRLGATASVRILGGDE